MFTSKFGLYLAILICLAWASPTVLWAQEDLTVLDDWFVYKDARNSLYEHLNQEAQRLLATRRQGLAQHNTTDKWLEYQERTRRTLTEIVGPFPERTPLNPVITGVIRKAGYRVEKLVYESRPGFFVTAALFLPDNLKGKAPGILFCSGHTEDGFRSDTYQTMILNLVHKGFIVLAFDPYGQGERQDYLVDEAGNISEESAVGGPTKQHSYAGAQLFLLGSSLANYMIWDGIRSIDYLTSRPEVDPSKIGVTGRSGGGTQTAYIAAMDDRVVAAAPEAYITSFERLLTSRGPQDAEQNLYHGIRAGLNHGDLLAVRAPKPALVITTTRDFFSIQGARETYEEVRKGYAFLGAASALQIVEDDAGHESTVKNREAMYRFFMKAFGLKGSAKDVRYTPLTASELQVTIKGQVLFSLDGLSVFDVAADRVNQIGRQLQNARRNASGFLDNVKADARSLSGFQPAPAAVRSVFTGQYQRSGYRVEKHFLEGTGAYVVPFLVMRPDTAGPHPVVIVLDPEGKQNVVKPGGRFEEFVQKGYAVIAADMLGHGELGPGDFRGDAYIEDTDLNSWFASVLTGKSITGVQASDLSLLAKYAASREDLVAQKMAGVAFGEMNGAMLYAAALDDAFAGVALMQSPGSSMDLVENKYYAPQYMTHAVAGSLPYYDLPDVQAALAPDWLLIANPVDQQGVVLEEDALNKRFEFVRSAYQDAGQQQRLSIVRTRGNYDLLSWLSRVFE